jgi:iron complex transport system permease protein
MLGGTMMQGPGVDNLVVSVFSSNVLVRLGLTGAAFAGAVLAVLLTLALSRGVQHTLRLLLAGVVVGVVLGAMTHLVLLWSPDSLQAMQAFMLGSTGFVGWTACCADGFGVGRVCGGWRLAGPRARRPEPGRSHRPQSGPAAGHRCAWRWWRCWRWPPARRWRKPA